MGGCSCSREARPKPLTLRLSTRRPTACELYACEPGQSVGPFCLDGAGFEHGCSTLLVRRAMRRAMHRAVHHTVHRPAQHRRNTSARRSAARIA